MADRAETWCSVQLTSYPQVAQRPRIARTLLLLWGVPMTYCVNWPLGW
jgi:hypothetical protein